MDFPLWRAVFLSQVLILPLFYMLIDVLILIIITTLVQFGLAKITKKDERSFRWVPFVMIAVYIVYSQIVLAEIL